jgi:hypothetical protein
MASDRSGRPAGSAGGLLLGWFTNRSSQARPRRSSASEDRSRDHQCRRPMPLADASRSPHPTMGRTLRTCSAGTKRAGNARSRNWHDCEIGWMVRRGGSQAVLALLLLNFHAHTAAGIQPLRTHALYTRPAPVLNQQATGAVLKCGTCRSVQCSSAGSMARAGNRPRSKPVRGHALSIWLSRVDQLSASEHPGSVVQIRQIWGEKGSLFRGW